MRLKSILNRVQKQQGFTYVLGGKRARIKGSPRRRKKNNRWNQSR